MMAEWNRFDICEAVNLIAHDWGLYDVKARLDAMRFRCAPSAEFYRGLTDNGRAIYHSLNYRIRAGKVPLKTTHLTKGVRYG